MGRGQPVGDRVLMAGLSAGRLPELSGTLPDLGVNPIPHSDSLTTSTGGLDILGVAVGLSESVDVGISGSRGLHSTIRLKHGGHWSLSISPAYYRFASSSTSEPKARASNLNVTGLLSLDPWPGGSFLSDAYTGFGVNRYSASIDTGMGSGSHAAVVPTMLVGLRLGGPGCWPFCRPDDPRLFSFGAEAQGAWLRQRDGRRDFVPTLRVFLSVGVRVPERTRVGYRAPPRRGCS